MAVREPAPAAPTTRLPVVVINPVLAIPVWVEVPDTVRFLEMFALSVMYSERLANSPPLKVEVAVVEVA